MSPYFKLTLIPQKLAVNWCMNGDDGRLLKNIFLIKYIETAVCTWSSKVYFLPAEILPTKPTSDPTMTELPSSENPVLGITDNFVLFENSS